MALDEGKVNGPTIIVQSASANEMTCCGGSTHLYCPLNPFRTCILDTLVMGLHPSMMHQ